MEIFKRYWLIILIGFILRLVISGVTFHPDVRSTALPSAVVFREGSLNFYEDSKKLSPNEILDDLPLSYFINLPLHLILRPFISNVIEDQFLNNSNVLFGNPSLWFYLIYTKLPLVIFDLGLGLLLTFLVVESFKKQVLYLWLFNPFTLWVTLAIGQFDIIPTFFIVLTWFLIKKEKLQWAALTLGTGGAIKSAPFLLVPFLVGLGKNWTQRVILLILALVPYLITVIPYLGTDEFRRNALFAPQLSKSLYANIALSGGEKIILVPAILLVLYLLYFSKKREIRDFLNFSLILLLSVLSLTHFHIQWFLWVMPFLIIWLLGNWHNEIKLTSVGIFLSLLIMLFLFDSSLQIKLPAPIFPGLDNSLGLKEILSDEQGIFLRSVAASIFAGVSGFLVWRVLRNSE